jgi:ABC-type multidrug transport system ATPase subunit
MGTIALRGLTKRFGATVAVDDLTASVRPGSVTAFLGPNGAGKTTTLRMVLGLIAPTAGTTSDRRETLPRAGGAGPARYAFSLGMGSDSASLRRCSASHES